MFYTFYTVLCNLKEKTLQIWKIRRICLYRTVTYGCMTYVYISIHLEREFGKKT